MNKTLLALALALAMGAAQAHDDEHGDGHDVSKVNGSVSAEAGRAYGDLDTVNGSIRMGDKASADLVETVNGSVTLGEGARAREVSTVNGSIRAGRNVEVAEGAETVNGSIEFDDASRVGGDVGTVNGKITLHAVDVRGRLTTVNGDVIVGARSVVHGGILLEKPHGMNWGFGKPRIPRVVIGPKAEVKGPIVFEREAELFVHATARVGEVSGVKAQAYTDKLPPRP
jgi:DUF4097 and DUF4098 domain-containing protein YvlB